MGIDIVIVDVLKGHLMRQTPHKTSIAFILYNSL